ncbi:hypothetical protein ACJX0J_015905 [Zea mays]
MTWDFIPFGQVNVAYWAEELVANALFDASLVVKGYGEELDDEAICGHITVGLLPQLDEKELKFQKSTFTLHKTILTEVIAGYGIIALILLTNVSGANQFSYQKILKKFQIHHMLRDKKRYFRILLFYLLTYDEFEFENLYSTKLDNKVHLYFLDFF